MVLRCSTIAAVALAIGLLGRPALAQAGASVSLTHTVSVTVPPRLKVQVATPRSQSNLSISPGGSGAVAISVSATQSWALSIAARGETSSLQWSTDEHPAFSRITGQPATIASGQFSQIPALATLFLRNSGGDANGSLGEPAAVVLTVVAP